MAPLRNEPPTRLTRATRWLGLARDLITMLVGLGVLVSTPPSISDFGAVTFAQVAWSCLPLIGGALCFWGLYHCGVRTKVVGSFTVAAGFLAWTLAIALTPGATLVSYAVAGAFLTLSLSTVLRGLVVAAGLLPADRAQ